MKKVIEKIRNAIENTEFAGRTYIAGGFVRDLIMGNTTDDLDITVELPEGGIRLAHFLYEKGIASKPVLYQEFGTALTIVNSYRIEFVMTRNESYRKGCRKPATSSGTIKEDIYRRDFTINSLIMDIMSGEILDITGRGMDDIKNGIIRATNDPDFIFNDDPLRILRAVRFANRFQFEIEVSTEKGIFADKDQLVNISWERKRDEFKKILLSKTPEQGVKLLYKYDLMKFIINELADKEGLIDYCSLQRMDCVLIPRLALLLDVIYNEQYPKNQIREILMRLKFSRIVYKSSIVFLELMKIIRNLLENDNTDDLALRKHIFFNKEDFAKNLNYLGRIYEGVSAFSDLRSEYLSFHSVLRGIEYPITGDIIKDRLGIPQSRRVGELYHIGLENWLRDPKLSKDEILALF